MMACVNITLSNIIVLVKADSRILFYSLYMLCLLYKKSINENLLNHCIISEMQKQR